MVFRRGITPALICNRRRNFVEQKFLTALKPVHLCGAKTFSVFTKKLLYHLRTSS